MCLKRLFFFFNLTIAFAIVQFRQNMFVVSISKSNIKYIQQQQQNYCNCNFCQPWWLSHHHQHLQSLQLKSTICQIAFDLVWNFQRFFPEPNRSWFVACGKLCTGQRKHAKDAQTIHAVRLICVFRWCCFVHGGVYSYTYRQTKLYTLNTNNGRSEERS